MEPGLATMRGRLGAALRNRESIYTIQELLDIEPDILWCRSTASGRLPIHEACAYHLSLPLVSKFLLNAPETFGMTANDGSTPLHWAVRSESKCLDVLPALWLLLFHHPKALMQPDRRGRLPLHCACMLGISGRDDLVQMRPEVFRLLLDRFADASTALDKDRNTPIHLLATSIYQIGVTESVRTIADMIIQATPEALGMTNSAGKTPLHILAANRASGQSLYVYAPNFYRRVDDGVLLLSKAYPVSCLLQDDNAKLPLGYMRTRRGRHGVQSQLYVLLLQHHVTLALLDMLQHPRIPLPPAIAEAVSLVGYDDDPGAHIDANRTLLRSPGLQRLVRQSFFQTLVHAFYRLRQQGLPYDRVHLLSVVSDVETLYVLVRQQPDYWCAA